MGVDGIGGSGGRPPVHGPGAAELARTERVNADPVQGTGAAPAAGGIAGSAPLQQLARGEINVDQYLDTRVSVALQHLEGRLPPSQLEFVRQALREEMSSDPVLVELVRRTTGSTPAIETE